MTKRLWLLSAFAILLPAAGSAQPCTSGRPNDICERAPLRGATEESAPARASRKPTGARAKVSAPLRGVLSNVQQQAIDSVGQTAAARPSTNLVRVNPAGEVQVYVELAEFGPEHVARLESLGLRIQTRLPQFRLIQGWLPTAAVDAVAALDFVKEVRQPDYRVPNAIGAAGTEGESIVRADAARAVFGVSGAGVKVGVISDGIDFLGVSQQTADLAFVEVLRAGAGNEGTAMLEIVHDLAPGAALAFWGPDTSVEMAQGIDVLRDVGARVIVDDLSFLGEPKFQDGIVAQTIQAFAQNGRAYAGSAGNRAQQHYRAVYSRLSGQEFPSSAYPGVHNYTPGDADIGNTIEVRNGCSISVTLQWSNPWGAANDDFDLVVARSSDFALLALSDNVQAGTQNPIEFTSWTNTTGETVAVFIAVAEYSLARAPESLVLDYFAIPSCDALQYVSAQQSLSGNHAVNEMFSTAAVAAATPNVAEDYSSRGPHDIFFPAFDRRFVPNITAPDCVQTYTGQQGHFSNPFCGTSAAAPHVAGVLALLLQTSPALDSQQIRGLVMGTAFDLGDAGFDFTYGFGGVDAVNAIAFSPLPPFAVVEANGTSFRAGQAISLALTAANPPGNPTLDLYVGALMPDGNTVLFLTQPNAFGVGQLSAPASMAPVATARGGFAVGGFPVLSFNFPASGIPAGTYKVFAALFRQGSLGDNAIGNGDLITLQVIDVAYSP
jgi:Subtilase family